MVRYGAELVFSSEAQNITEADIEAILTKGEKDTKVRGGAGARERTRTKRRHMESGARFRLLKLTTHRSGGPLWR